jgi:hypothetical protein
MDFFHAKRPHYAILWTSEKMFDLASTAVWHSARKYFQSAERFKKVLVANPPTGFSRWLGKVELDFSIPEYFRFFGVRVNPMETWSDWVEIDSSESLGPLLKSVEMLENLHLRFPSSYDDSVQNPWVTMKRDVWHFHPEFSRHLPRRPVVCNHAIVHWILIFAFPYISHIPNIRLTGYIKTSLKN